jgi:aminoglycoside 2'-N-acetyltransferase I
MTLIRQVASSELTPGEVAALRALFDDAWRHKEEPFDDDDFRHAFGGVHLLMEEGSEIVGHASVVQRELRTGDHRLATGYVEAVATRPDRQHRGIGTALMHAVAAHIEPAFELGALDTGIAAFYERLGWTVWAGPTFVWKDVGPEPTPDEDGSVLVLRTSTTPDLDLTSPLMCEWRPGDVW